jgi:broad specificity phosphatase PhoE
LLPRDGLQNGGKDHVLGTDARKLILVKHSQPEIVPDVPSHQWKLSDVGCRRCQVLAERLAAYEPAVIVTSFEPKAMDTGRIVADALGVRLETAPDLHEHDRREVEFLADQEEFRSQVISFLEHPSELVFGSETADEAHRRFAAAITDVVAHHPGGNLVVIAHGTVIALFVARVAPLDPVSLWKSLGLPSFAVLALPGYQLLKVVENVEKGRGRRPSDHQRRR